MFRSKLVCELCKQSLPATSFLACEQDVHSSLTTQLALKPGRPCCAEPSAASK